MLKVKHTSTHTSRLGLNPGTTALLCMDWPAGLGIGLVGCNVKWAEFLDWDIGGHNNRPEVSPARPTYKKDGVLGLYEAGRGS